MRPDRARSRTTARIIASMFFMSTAPRPQTQSSRISAENGSTCQSAAWAGTTSRWPCTSSAGRLESAPAIRVSTLVRPGADSTTVGSSPTSASHSATCSAALRSPGPVLSPKLEVSIRISSRHSSTTSSWAVSEAWSAVASRIPSPWSGRSTSALLGCSLGRLTMGPPAGRCRWISGPGGATLAGFAVQAAPACVLTSPAPIDPVATV